MLSRLFKGSDQERRVATLYGHIVEQARSAPFFAAAGVPDTVEGRFELIALHGWLVMRRLGRDPAAAVFNQALFDYMFADMDLNLRELGVGDLGVSKKIKDLASHFYGRVKAYEDGVAPDAPPEALEGALDRNLFGSTLPEPAQVAAMAAYVRAAEARLAAQGTDLLMAGSVDFGPALAS